MKNKTIGAFMIICLLLVTTKMYASVPKTDEGIDNVIQRYINSIVTSDYKELRAVLDENLRFKIPHRDHLMIYNKSAIVDDIKSRSGRLQDFQPGYLVLAKSDAVTIVQVDFKYGATIMQNFIFLEKDLDQQWKISQVYEMFKTTDTVKTTDGTAVSK
jgi:hypothetical protein